MLKAIRAALRLPVSNLPWMTADQMARGDRQIYQSSERPDRAVRVSFLRLGRVAHAVIGAARAALSPVILALVLKQKGEVVVTGSKMGMVVAQNRLVDLDSPTIERLGLVILALVPK